MRNGQIAVAAIALGVIVYSVSSRTQTSKPLHHLQQELNLAPHPAHFKVSRPVEEDAQPAGINKNASPETLAAPSLAQPVISLMPMKNDVRDEARSNPHSTPRSVLLFSTMLSDKLEAAQKNPAQAPILFEELRECATTKGEAAVATVQALCLLNARRLTTKYSDLNGNLHQLEQSVNPQLAQMLKILD